MEINEEIMRKLKTEITEDDLKKMKRDLELKHYIDETFDDVDELYRFLMLYCMTFLTGNNINIEDFINSLRTSYDVILQVEKIGSRGH